MIIFFNRVMVILVQLRHFKTLLVCWCNNLWTSCEFSIGRI